MKYIISALMLTSSALTAVWSQEIKSSSPQIEYTVQNRKIEQLTESNRAIVRFSEGEGAGIAWIKDLVFSEGTIEFDARGRDVLQKSFIGIAFHGVNNKLYEAIYFRPFNFQSVDSVRRIHAIQYSFEPNFGFQQLRDTQKDKYESAIKPAIIKATDWFKVKIQVKAGNIKVFLNDEYEASMIVKTLNPNPVGSKIGFWVGNNSNGDFANLKISK